MRALSDAILASSSPRPYTRPELDKLFGNYDCLVESPCYLGRAGIEAYLADPEVKFILTQRSASSFAKSLEGSLGYYYGKLHRFPLCVTRWCDPFVYELERMFGLMTHRWSGGLHPGDPGFRAALEGSYEEYQAMVRELVPAERMLVLDLDKGFGWEEICEFLGKDVPETEYPRANSMAEFHVAAEMVLAPAVRKTYAIMGVVGAVGVGLGAWVVSKVIDRGS
jgi:hypothetical protein